MVAAGRVHSNEAAWSPVNGGMIACRHQGHRRCTRRGHDRPSPYLRPSAQPKQARDRFSWPIDPLSADGGVDGACGDWPGDPNGCCLLASGWRDASPFQRHEVKLKSLKGYHLGADWNCGSGGADLALPVYPTAKGTVSRVVVEPKKTSWGNTVFIVHQTSFGTFTSVYADVNWLASGPPAIGSAVTPSVAIAVVGDANGYYKDEAHLHFEIRSRNDTTIGAAYTPSAVLVGPEGQLDPNAFVQANRGDLPRSSPHDQAKSRLGRRP